MGMNEARYLLDTSFVIDYLATIPCAASYFTGIVDSGLFASVVTRIELLCSASVTRKNNTGILRFLDNIGIVPLTPEVERHAIAIRRATGKKLPDAIIAASAVAMDAVLVTSDKRLAATSFPGLRTVNPQSC